MDLKTVISDSSRISKFPTVITDEVFTVSFFNEAAKKLIPDLTTGAKFDEYVTIYDKNDLKRSKYPSSAIIGCGGEKYFCAFCPVISGFIKECVFSLAVPDGEEYDDCEQYLSMKLAVISKCIGGTAESAPAGRERAYARYYSGYEANMRMLAAMAGDDHSSAVNIKELLEEIFTYYGEVKYGTEQKKRFGIETSEDYVKIKKAVCIILVYVYDLCQALSRNGFCAVSVNSSMQDRQISFSFSVRPKHKLSSLLEEADGTEDAVYSLLGRGAENILMIKTLARHIRGQADIKYDVYCDEFSYCVTIPYDKSSYVKASGRQFADIARIAVQTCIISAKKA